MPWPDGSTDPLTGPEVWDRIAAARPFDATFYGVVADGTTDVSTELQAAIDAAAANGARVDLPPGTIIAQGIELASNVILQAHAAGTTIKLADGADQDLLTVAGFSTLTAGTTQGGPTKFGLRDVILDGNNANNASGWPFRVYGRSYLMDHVEVKNGKSGGVWSQWGTGGDDMDAHWSNWKIHDNEGTGLDWNGPHDSLFVNGIVAKNTGKGIVTHGSATSEQFTNVHVWGEHTYGCHFLAPVYAVNCQTEGATGANLVLDCNFGSWIGGAIFGTNTGVETGILVGLDSTGRYWDVETRVYNLASGGKPIDYAASNKNHIRINLYAASVTQAVYGTPAAMDHIDIWCIDNPQLASDWADQKIMGPVTFYNGDASRGAQINVYNDRNYLLLDESAGTPSAVSNAAVIFCEDSGGGKTQLFVRFGTGAAQLLATEP